MKDQKFIQPIEKKGGFLMVSVIVSRIRGRWLSRFVMGVPLVVYAICTLLTLSPAYAVGPTRTFIWVMDTGSRIGEFHLSKLTPEGEERWRVQFGQSEAIGVDPGDGSVWAPELNDNLGNSNQVVKLDANGSLVRKVQGYRTGIIAVDPNDGSVWVGLPNEHQVVKLDADGNRLLIVSGFDAPASMTVDPTDSSVWIADGGGSAGRKVVKLASNGEEICRRNTPGFFSDAPQQTTVDPRDGSMWYTGFDSGNVFKISATCTALQPPVIATGFDRPISVAVDPTDSSVWVADFSVATPGALVKLNLDGSELYSLSLGTPPHVVAVHPEDGSVWVGIEGALVQFDANGNELMRLDRFRLPKAIVIATVTDVSIPIRFAAIGDYGSDNSNELDVANLVKRWNPDLIITTGDNSFSGAIDESVGKYFCEYIGDYIGIYCGGVGSSINRFFPAIGNHDYTDGGGINEYLNYFTLPGAGIPTSGTSGNERYYDFVQGPVHFFVVDSNPANTGAPGDGRSDTSPQAGWLRGELAASTSPWKIVYMHHPPYSSGATHGSTPDMQWNYEAWGATAVLASHDHLYERIHKDRNNDGTEFLYFVTGAGGRGKDIKDLYGFDARLEDGSQVRCGKNGTSNKSVTTVSNCFGSMIIDATSASITFEYYSVERRGKLVDTYTIGTPTVPRSLPILEGVDWRYFPGTEEPPTGWNTDGFDDSGWLVGPSGLGYGDGDDATVLSDMQGNYISVYLRKEFTVADPSTVTGLELSMDYDDSFVAYLNGDVVARANVTGNPPDYDTAADGDHEAGRVEYFLIDASVLLQGTNVLAIQGHNKSLTSSDFSLIPTLEEVVPEPQTLPIQEGDDWRYFPGTEEPPTGWNTYTDFDDSSWLVGPSGFGYGDGDDATVLSDMQGDYISVYLRKEFTVADPSTVTELELSMDYDDSFVAYLNGYEVARANVTGTPPAYDRAADGDHEAGRVEYFLIDASILLPGTNVLAIQGHNKSLTSSDFSLIPTLEE